MSRQVGGYDGVTLGERLDHAAPVVAGAGHPMDQQQDRPLTAAEVTDGAPV
jgi:hypothetical protein